MLATFVIGLREGLEAALIVGIIAAFLRNNHKSLTGMWLGVTLAVVLSAGVGIGLKLAERALPQAAQEGLETVIGVIAVIFVTSMIVWMNSHARGLKGQLEGKAAAALGQTGTRALALMACLAVLKEGFETSVFLLATFSVAQSVMLAALGAVLGVLAAIVIGWGIYAGSVRINLSRFFRITGGFLILVAAGLIIGALRTAHEAGWLNVGQQATLNLAWLVQPGTVQSALITGVLGIPADPRLIEVLAWFAYLVPVALIVYWPRSLRPQPRTAALLRLALAGVLALAAFALAVSMPLPHATVPEVAPIVQTGESGNVIGSLRLSPATDSIPGLIVLRDGATAQSMSFANARHHQTRHFGMTATVWERKHASHPQDTPATVSLQQVVALSGGRLPVGLDARRNPGPFSVTWTRHHNVEAWIVDGVLLDASARIRLMATLSDGGLQTPRTIPARAIGTRPSVLGWKVADTYRNQTATALRGLAASRTEHAFWARQLPIALLVLALALVSFAVRRLHRSSPRANAMVDSQASGL